MPMNRNFNWRPNDRSATTMLRYRVEAERWMEGINSAVSSQTRNNPVMPLVVISQILTLAFCILVFVVLGLKYFFNFILGLIATSKASKEVEECNEPRVLTFKPIDPNDYYADEKSYFRAQSEKLTKERFNNK
jgi:hypothetical protein